MVRVCGGILVFILILKESNSEYNDPGTVLYLTPYIEAGRIQEARAAAKVNPLLADIKSYSGYITTNQTTYSNFFFWFFPSEQNWESKEVLLWLQGGPGASSLFGLLHENGPMLLSKHGLTKNPYSWNRKLNVLYLDNPVGTGFSFTNSTDGYAKSQEEIGTALLNFLKQFFQLFPELVRNNFFLTGESYAGKYIPSVALAIHKFNENSSKAMINLKGLFIGNGMVDPENMLHYGEYLYQLGLLDSNGKAQFQNLENEIKNSIKTKNWNEATNGFSKLVMDYYYSNNTLLTNLTGLIQHYNFVTADEFDIQPFVSNVSVRRALHVGSNQFNDGKAVALALKEDIMKSMKSVVELLLEHYNILFYNGQLDIICAYPLTENVLQQLEWSGKDKYHSAQRTIWKVNGEVAGYCKSGGGLTEVMVRNAGHLVPTDQPAWAFDLVARFVTLTYC